MATPNFAQSRFNKAGGQPGAGRPISRPQSRFAGVNSADAYGQRDPDVEPGDYIFEVKATIESKIQGRKPWFKISVEVIEALSPTCSPVGTTSTIRWCTNQESEGASFPKMKLWAMACVGVDNDADYDAMEESQGVHKGGFLDDASLGGQTFVGCRFAARAFHGKPDGNGGHYNEYIFAIAGEQQAT
jgi:hypothetical protein